MRTHDLLVLGDCNADLILRGDVAPRFGQEEQILSDAHLTLGGSGAIVAAGAARLGLRTAIVAVVGNDAFGRMQLEVLAGRGVDTSGVVIDYAQRTGLSVILCQGEDRSILTHPGTIGVLEGGHIDRELLHSSRHVHVSSYFLQHRLQLDLAGVLAEAHALGSTTSLDPNWDPSGGWNAGLSELLPHVDWFLPNSAEACLIAREEDVELAASNLGTAANVVVKVGRSGALAVQGDVVTRAPALSTALVDTVGAGDSFDAGFLAGYLWGWPVGRALTLACACGSLSTRASGGIDAQPSLEEALEACESTS